MSAQDNYIDDVITRLQDQVERACAKIDRLEAALRYIKNLPLGDELDIARRAARKALEGK